MTDIVPYKPLPTLMEFHKSDAFVRGIVGPFSSGKSAGMCWEIFFKCQTQYKQKDGFRRSRWACIRNTKDQLKQTTLKTWLQWFPDGIAGRYAVSDMTYHLEYGDVKAEILFLALDTPDDVRKLLSLELTGAWVNEARELPLAVIDGLTGRVGRYPRAGDGGCRWAGIIMDTNPPDDDHWWFKRFEIQAKDDPQVAELYKIFHQPPAVLKKDGRWVENPQAENLANNRPNYYLNMVIGKDPEWIKVYAQGQYGIVSDGRPVYSGYNDQLHCAEFEVNPRLPVYIGWDYSFNGQACVLAQLSPAGQLRIFHEWVGEAIGLHSFVVNVVKPELTKYGKLDFRASTGDPAGAKHSDVDEKFALGMLNDAYPDMLCGLPFQTYPADTNSLGPRIDGVNHFLNKLIDGAPALLLHPRCSVMRKGFLGRYEFKRLQVVGEDRYKDVPAKNRYSHCFTWDAMVSTPDGPMPIASLNVGDLVNTPIGPKRVLNVLSRMSGDLYSVGGLTCTSDHPFATINGSTRADELQYSSVFTEDFVWDADQFIRYRNSTEYGSIASHLATTRQIGRSMAASTCTVTSGLSITGRFQKVSTFITRTTTRLITGLKTSFAYHLKNMLENMSGAWMTPIWSASGHSLSNGTNQKRAESGIANTQSVSPHLLRISNTFVSNVVKNTKQSEAQERKGIALADVRRLQESHLEWMTSQDSAGIAGLNSEQTNTESNGFARLTAKPVRGVRRVYDITVEDAHAFYANGYLVFNCQDALQYLCRGILADSKIEEPEFPEVPHSRISYSGY